MLVTFKYFYICICFGSIVRLAKKKFIEFKSLDYELGNGRKI